MNARKKNEPCAVEIKGHQLKCPVCSNNRFFSRRAQLNTAVASFFNFDWTNRSASCYVCSECSHISWFIDD